MDFSGAVGLRSTIIEQNEMTFILDALSKDSHLSSAKVSFAQNYFPLFVCPRQQ